MRSSITGHKTSSRSVADNVIFKNRAQNIECSLGCVPRSAVLLKLNVANPLKFLWRKIRSTWPITIAIDCNGLPLLIFQEKWSNYVAGPKSAPNNDSFWMRRIFNVCMLVYIPAKIKMSFIWKDDFFFCQNAQHCSSVYTIIFVRRKDKTNYLANQTWAKCYRLL